MAGSLRCEFGEYWGKLEGAVWVFNEKRVRTVAEGKLSTLQERDMEDIELQMFSGSHDFARYQL